MSVDKKKREDFVIPKSSLPRVILSQNPWERKHLLKVLADLESDRQKVERRSEFRLKCFKQSREKQLSVHQRVNERLQELYSTLTLEKELAPVMKKNTRPTKITKPHDQHKTLRASKHTSVVNLAPGKKVMQNIKKNTPLIDMKTEKQKLQPASFTKSARVLYTAQDLTQPKCAVEQSTFPHMSLDSTLDIPDKVKIRRQSSSFSDATPEITVSCVYEPQKGAENLEKSNLNVGHLNTECVYEKNKKNEQTNLNISSKNYCSVKRETDQKDKVSKVKHTKVITQYSFDTLEDPKFLALMEKVCRTK